MLFAIIASAALPARADCVASPAGLVSWWRAETNAADVYGGNDGFFAGDTGFAQGRVGQAFMLDGYNDRVAVGTSVSLQLQNFSIEAWIKRASATVVSFDQFNGVGGMIFAGGQLAYGFGLEDSGRLFLARLGVSSVTFSPGIADTNWHHVAVTKSGASVIFYVDGVANAAPAYDPGFSFFYDMSVGARGAGEGNSFYGLIDEPSVYGRALTPAEIQSIYDADNEGKCVFTAPPSIVTQPLSRMVTSTTDVLLTVTALGSPPLSYQWRKNGTNMFDDGITIFGANYSMLWLGSVTTGHAGDYTVVVSNDHGSVTSAVAVLTVQSFSYYEPFDYLAGANLIGQTSPDGLVWTTAGPTGTQTIITNGSLVMTGFASRGNGILFGVATGPSARLSLPSAHTTTNGTLYYSFLFRVLNLGALSTSGGFFAGFNTASGTQSTTPTAVATRVLLRSTGSGGFNIGLSKTSGQAGQFVWDSTEFTTNDVIFIVGSYRAGFSEMWINPDPASFGGPFPPLSTLTSHAGTLDHLTISSFVFFRRGSGNATLQPSAMLADELRLGSSWADVTMLSVNHLPVAGADSIARLSGGSVKVLASTLLTNDLDADSDMLSVASVTATSAQGGAVMRLGPWVSYSPPESNPASDSFTYMISDGRGGMATGTVSVSTTLGSEPSRNIVSLEITDGTARITFVGIPSQLYLIQAATNMTGSVWETIGTNVSGVNGLFEFVDTAATNFASRFYRTAQP